MRILIIRTHASTMSSIFTGRYYNIQEIGIAKALNRMGHQCDVVFWNKTEDKTFEVQYSPESNFKVFFRKGIPFLKNVIYFNLKKLISNYDIIHTSEYDQIYSWMLSRQYPDKTIIYHGPYYCGFNRKYNMKCRILDLLFVRSYLKANTPFMTKSPLAERFLLEKGIKNIRTVGVGLDDEQMDRDNMEPSELSLKLQKIRDSGSRLLLYIGQLEPRRNIPFLLNVFAGVHKLCKDTKLVIIGSGEDSYIRKCWSIADKLGIRGDIVYQDKMPQNLLPAVYSCCSIFLLPTLYEIFGMVLLESMYFGCVPVSTYNGGTATLINNGENGFVLDNLDLKIWVDTLTRILSNDELMEKCSESAVNMIKNNYTWDVLTNKFITAYENMLCENEKQ